MPKTAHGSFRGFRRYAIDKCGLSSVLSELSSKAKGKCYSPSFAIQSFFFGMIAGCKSASDIETFAREYPAKTSRSLKGSRGTFKGLLNEERTKETLNQSLFNMVNVCKKKRIHKPPEFFGYSVAYVDGVHLHTFTKKHDKCKFCLKRVRNKGKKNERVEYYHLGVSISLCTKIGPVPIAFGLAESDKLSHDFDEMDAADQKHEGEKSVTKKLLISLAEYHGGKLPFDLLGADSLYPDAPHTELVESLGAKSISVYKQNNRLLKKEATRVFEGQGLGFDHIYTLEWTKNPSNKKRTFSSKTVILRDENRKGDHKEVFINQTVRTESDGSQVINSYMSSSGISQNILPRILENMRFYRWSQQENKVFNALTNDWGILKHPFYHTSNAMLSVFFIMFLCLGIFNLYSGLNLNRSGRKFIHTMKSFFKRMYVTFFLMLKILKFSFPIGRGP